MCSLAPQKESFQCICISSHHLVLCKYLTILFVNFTSINKTGHKNKSQKQGKGKGKEGKKKGRNIL